MNVWIHITAGQGPAECQWAVARLTERFQHEAAVEGIGCRVLDVAGGEEAHTARSALLALETPSDNLWLRSWIGTVQWIGRSPFRPTHRRKNWFVAVGLLTPLDKPAWSQDDIKMETFRASGPGGQHVNKTSSAVRLTHAPTGLVATAQEERSQHRNRKLASARLAEALAELERSTLASVRKNRWKTHAQLARGNPVRIYCGAEMIRIR